MKLQIPKTLKVGPFRYTVQLKAAWDAAKGSENYGKTNFPNLEIFIDGTAHRSMQEETFIHEMLHTINSAAGIQNNLDMTEEELVRRQSPVLYQILKDNNLFTK